LVFLSSLLGCTSLEILLPLFSIPLLVLGCTSLELLLVVFLFSHLSILKMRGYFVKNKLKKELDVHVTASQTSNYVARRTSRAELADCCVDWRAARGVTWPENERNELNVSNARPAVYHAK
jgi:hypothetical protein